MENIELKLSTGSQSIPHPKAARVAGLAIILMTLAAVAANDLTINRLVVAENAAETMKNITSSELLFRTGIFSWFIVLICDLLAAWGLYIFLRPVHHNLSLLMAWFRMIYVAILGASLLNLLYVLPFLDETGYSSVSGTRMVQNQVLFYVNAFFDAWSLGLVVFGIHILLLAYLLLKSGYRVVILGILLIIAFVGYILINVTKLLFPDLERIIGVMNWIFLLPMLSEPALGVWLLTTKLRRKDMIDDHQ